MDLRKRMKLNRTPCVGGNFRRRSTSVCRRLLPEIWADFCEFTTLHGVSHIYQDSRRPNEASTINSLPSKYIRLWKVASILLWGGSFLTGSLLAIMLTYFIWNRSLETPTIVAVETYYYPAYDVPFPSVSICSINVVHRPAMETVLHQFVDGGFNATAMQIVFSQLSHFVKLFDYAGNVTTEMKQFQLAMKKFNYTVETLMLKVMEPCSSFIEQCTFLNRFIPCEQLFFISKTTEGFCCSFNHKYLYNYKEYTNKSLSDLYGYRVNGGGEYNGLSVIIQQNMDSYISYTRSSRGVLFDIHAEDEFADLNKLTLLEPAVGFKYFVLQSVVRSDKAIRSLPFSKRKCLFEDERPLKVTDKYSVASCLADCRVRHYISLCNCIPFYYPHLALPEYASIEQCSFEHLPCLHRIRTMISSFRPPENAIGFHEVSNKSLLGIDCPECAPTCNQVTYGSSTSPNKAKSSANNGPKLEPTNAGDEGSFNYTSRKFETLAWLLVAFNEGTCIQYKRTVCMSWDTLFANVGGAFGLCLGASIISLFEIVYFVGIRMLGRILAQKFTQKTHPFEIQIQTIQQLYDEKNYFGGFIR